MTHHCLLLKGIVKIVNTFRKCVPYSGKIWREINFGGLANLSRGPQIKNTHAYLYRYIIYVHEVSLEARPTGR